MPGVHDMFRGPQEYFNFHFLDNQKKIVNIIKTNVL